MQSTATRLYWEVVGTSIVQRGSTRVIAVKIQWKSDIGHPRAIVTIDKLIHQIDSDSYHQHECALSSEWTADTGI